MCGGGTEHTAFFPVTSKTDPIFNFSEKVENSPTTLEKIQRMADNVKLTLDTTGVDTSTEAGLRTLLGQLALHAYRQQDPSHPADSQTVRRFVERLMAQGSRCELKENHKKLREMKFVYDKPQKAGRDHMTYEECMPPPFLSAQLDLRERCVPSD